MTDDMMNLQALLEKSSDADLLRELFESVVRRCMREGLVGGEGFAVRVLTDSMAPTVAPGDIAVVRRQQVAMPGEIVVVLLEDDAVLKVGHNVKYDTQVMATYGIALGPDGLLYVVVGNHTKIDGAIDPESPYRNFYEGDLNQPRYEDPGGHAVGIKAPGGMVIRTDIDGSDNAKPVARGKLSSHQVSNRAETIQQDPNHENEYTRKTV